MPDTKVVFEESQAGLNSAKLKTIADKADIIVKVIKSPDLSP